MLLEYKIVHIINNMINIHIKIFIDSQFLFHLIVIHLILTTGLVSSTATRPSALLYIVAAVPNPICCIEARTHSTAPLPISEFKRHAKIVS